MTTRTSKNVLIGLAAIGLVGGVYLAFVPTADAAKRAFTAEQREAIEEAKELRAEGDLAGARKVLEDANVFRASFKKHRVPTEEQFAKFAALRSAVENGDYAAFQAAAGASLASKIDTEADFDKLVEANELRKGGDYQGAREIMKALGFKHRLPRHGAHN